MKLRIKNEVLNKDLEPLRKKNARDINGNPYIHGAKLIPGAILMVHAKDLSVDDVLYVEKLVNAGCLSLMIMGQADHSMEHVKSYKNILPPTPTEEPVEEQTAAPEPEVEEPLPQEEIAEVVSEDIEEQEEAVEEEAVEEPSIIYTKTSLSKKKNSELRAILTDMDPELEISNKTKRELTSLILEIQNG